MRKLLWLALLAVPLIVVVTLPARVVVPHLAVGEDVRDVAGTVWQGNATWQQPGYLPVDLNWDWAGGRVWRWLAEGQGVDLEGRWRAAAGGTHLGEIVGTVSMDRLDARLWMVNARPLGDVELDIARAVLSDDRPPEIDGRIVWRNARLTGAVHESLGEITVRLDGGDGRQLAKVESTQAGAVQVSGDIELGVERYTVDLWLRAASDRPELMRRLAWLGEPQPDGQVRIELSGALGW